MVLLRRPPGPRLMGATDFVSNNFKSSAVGSRSKLNPADAARFDGSTLFGSLAGAVCEAGVLPRKELFECWEVASALHESFPNTQRVADLAAGHGLLAWVLALLASSEGGGGGVARTAVCVDVAKPKSAEALGAAITASFPWLDGAVEYVEGSIDSVEDSSGETLIVGVHACGILSDRVMDVAMRGANPSPIALLPCCHSLRTHTRLLEDNTVEGGSQIAAELRDAARTLGDSAAIDAFRLERLRRRGYTVEERFIPREITPCA